MGAPAIRVEGLSKRYLIGGPEPRGGHLREMVMGLLTAPFRRLFGGAARDGAGREFWALRDVSFEVPRGEVLGIVGANGVGKSTLLKIISRVTAPTAGRALLWGRVGSLLEVGTGFHPDLTGRENVYLNGTILGMRKREIDRKFDEIVAFAGVGVFIDTPVKRYSSGMYVRLAFAVAAHLDTEILVVDEVLAVGDAEFQKRCLGKMGDLVRSGRTVLFVSHNMGAIQRLCTSALLLSNGRIAAMGDPRAVAGAYMSGRQEASFRAPSRTGRVQLLEADVRNAAPEPLAHPVCTEPLAIELRYVVPVASPGLRIGIEVLAPDGTPLFTSNVLDADVEAPSAAGEYEARVLVPADTLLAGEFHLSVCIWNEGEIFDAHEPALSFTVYPGPSPLYLNRLERKGFIQVPCRWEIEACRPRDGAPVTA
jgi:homopolymeric O-antigen transport system ATP-binding protein